MKTDRKTFLQTLMLGLGLPFLNIIPEEKALLRLYAPVPIDELEKVKAWQSVEIVAHHTSCAVYMDDGVTRTWQSL
jgi:hypothetical protein